MEKVFHLNDQESLKPKGLSFTIQYETEGICEVHVVDVLLDELFQLSTDESWRMWSDVI